MKKMVCTLLLGFPFSAFTEEVTEGYWDSLKKKYTTAIDTKKKLMPIDAANKEQALQAIAELEQAQKDSQKYKQQLLKTISKANDVLQRPNASAQTIDAALKTVKTAGENLVTVETQISELQKAIDDINKQLARFK